MKNFTLLNSTKLCQTVCWQLLNSIRTFSKTGLGTLFPLLLFFLLSATEATAQSDTPCEGANRWTEGGSWNNDGTVDDKPSQADPTKGIIRCGNSADTQSQIDPFNMSVYQSASFEIDVADGGCVNPSTGLEVKPINPTNGQPIVWLNFDVRPFSGSFEVQINDNSGDNIGWALYVSNANQAGTSENGDTGAQLSGDCGDLRFVSCGVESSSTWNTIPVTGVDFLEPTNFYMAIWDQDADGDVKVNNFKARYGCGDGTIPICNLVVEEESINCIDSETYQVIVPIIGANAQYTAQDENALSISDDVCLNNLGDGGPIEGSFTLTYAIGTNYDIDIFALENPDIANCANPFNPTQCTGSVAGSSPELLTVNIPDQTICEDVTSVNLTLLEPEGKTGGVWSNSGGNISDATDVDPNNGPFTYTITDGVNSCSGSTEVNYSIIDTPVADELDDVTRCDSYELPPLSDGNAYWTGSGGTGSMLEAGDLITSSQTIYIYAAATAPCVADESEFDVTINETPDADELDDVTRCDSYELPPLSAGNAYWTGSGGTGSMMEVGDLITTSQTIYIYFAAVAPCVADESEFDVTINETPDADELDDVTRCDSYELPPLSDGNAYWTGSGGTGSMLEAGDLITSSQTIYIYAAATAPCVADESEFDVTINETPDADELDDVTRCDSYELPPLSAGNAYWTDSGGTGSMMEVGDLITTSQTIYIYFAAVAPCVADESEFDVTINETPDADELDDVTRCDSYELPPLSDGNAYWTGSGGTGSMLEAGDLITSSQTIYIYAAATAPCVADESEFDVTINETPDADELDDVTRCDSYELPPLSAGNAYWTGSGGTGSMMEAGDLITTSQTIYIYFAAVAPCVADESEFDVTINETPVADELDDVTRCDSYELPPLSDGNAYWTGSGGTGSMLEAGDLITSSQTIYIYAAATAPCVADESEFDVTINETPDADELDDVTRCDSYELPPLSAGNAYWTDSGGTGSMMEAGDLITTSQTIYIYFAAVAPCVADESEFDVTINETPVADELDDVTRCDSYELPPLSDGNAYWTGSGGTGSMLEAGDLITSSQTIYIYAAATAPCVADESEFDVTINETPDADELDDVTRCDSYELPPLSAGNAYWTDSGGTGSMMEAGDLITTSQTIYIYFAAVAPCVADESEFDVTINETPVADELDDVTRCDSYELPPLSDGNAYWTGSGGTGSMLEAGDLITSSQTIYIYAAATAPCVADESEFDVTINETPDADELDDVTRCDSYELPPLSAGNAYWTDSGGTGSMMEAGDLITTSQTIYIYFAAVAPCVADESEFDVTINETPDADELDDVTRCDSYELPPLSDGNAYWTGSGGTGSMLEAGDLITSSQTIYIYAAATAPCVADESEFDVTINETPDADELDDVTRCDSYELPPLSAGNAYWTDSGGTGSMMEVGDLITTSQTIYIYFAAVAPCVADESEFDVTINETPDADELDDVTRCDSYELPPLSDGNAYWTGSGGTGSMLEAGDLITSSQTIYIYAAATAPCVADESEFDVTINETPDADELDDVTRCDSYELPPLSAGNAYWTDSGGTGSMMEVGDLITTSQTIYIYFAAVAPCVADESEFDVTINETPDADELDDVTRCDSYELPPLSDGNAYWTGSGGTGSMLEAGDLITSSQTIYIYAAATAPCVADESEFDVTINETPDADELDDVTRCDSYELPPLSAGNAYWTDSGGTGSMMEAGDLITTSQTIYIYFAAVAPCVADESEFDVTINETPDADELDDVTRCDSYELPPLSDGNAYWTGSGGTGSMLEAGDLITSSQTIYIYAAATAPCVADESEFDVTINETPDADELDDVTRCDSYELPPLSAGNAYWTGSGGTGSMMEAGDLITTSQTIYIYFAAVAPCESDENELVITINDTPEIPEIETQLADCIGGDGSFIFLGDPQNLYISFDDGANFQLYTEDGISLPVGVYDFVIKFGNDGCISEPGQVEIQQLPATNFPLNPTITQPDCETGLGNVVIRVGINTDIDTGFFTYRITSGETVYYEEKQTLAGFDLPPGNYVIFGISDNGCDSGRTEITLEEPICEEFEGCTLGYWKNHTDRWSCYSTCTLYSEVFGIGEDHYVPDELQGKTLLQVLNLGGGGVYNMGRQSVAALLNICHGDVNYEILTEAELVLYVQDSFDNAGAAGSYLDELNNAGCTLGGSRATTAPSEGCDAPENNKPGKGKPGKNNRIAENGNFKASPVPFNERLTIQYDFEYTSNKIEIQVYDLNGRLLRTYNDKKVTKGDTKELDIDFALKANQVYIVRMITDREVISKNVISSTKK